ncbi:MAG TPA: hypothetical protein PLJ11_07445, partial [Methanomassiliicoccales archaeon]|nr:hypothetical protein [Methanomassiliicoccales archaeon]
SNKEGLKFCSYQVGYNILVGARHDSNKEGLKFCSYCGTAYNIEAMVRVIQHALELDSAHPGRWGRMHHDYIQEQV